MKKNLCLILSILCLIYFATLVCSSYNHIVFNNFFDAIFEFLTIPLIAVLLILFVTSSKSWYLDKFSLKSGSLLSILILSTTLISLVVSTIYNI